MLTYLMLLEEDADKARFQQLYERYRGPMYRTALRYLKDEGRAQDAVHDAFVKIALHFQKISALSCMELGSYIVTIVENRCIEILRKEKRRLDWDEDWDIPAPSGAEDEAGYRRLVALVDSMPETYREVLTLRYINGMKWDAVAASLNFDRRWVIRLHRRACEVVESRGELCSPLDTSLPARYPPPPWGE